MSKYHRPTHITEREQQVISLRADGMAGKEIAALLGLAETTVWEYQHRAMVKFGCRTIRGAIRRFKVERFRLHHNV